MYRQLSAVLPIGRARRVIVGAVAARPGLLAGLIAGLLAALPAVGAAAQGGKAATGSIDAALGACVPRDGGRMAVSGPDADGLYTGTDGTLYFAGELYLPETSVVVGGSANESKEDARAAEARIGARVGAKIGARIDAKVGARIGNGARRHEAVALGPANRWGLVPAWIVSMDGEGQRLLQAERIGRGDAVFAPSLSSGACADHLRQAETDARRRKTGLWKEAANRLVFRTAAPGLLSERAGHYVIAHGRVVSLGKTSRTRYLNFGRHWKTDFTVTLKVSEEDGFNAALSNIGRGDVKDGDAVRGAEASGPGGLRVETLSGQYVEVRGVVQERDGPYMALQHAEQLVVFENRRAGRDGQDSN